MLTNLDTVILPENAQSTSKICESLFSDPWDHYLFGSVDYILADNYESPAYQIEGPLYESDESDSESDAVSEEVYVTEIIRASNVSDLESVVEMDIMKYDSFNKAPNCNEKNGFGPGCCCRG